MLVAKPEIYIQRGDPTAFPPYISAIPEFIYSSEREHRNLFIVRVNPAGRHLNRTGLSEASKDRYSPHTHHPIAGAGYPFLQGASVGWKTQLCSEYSSSSPTQLFRGLGSKNRSVFKDSPRKRITSCGKRVPVEFGIQQVEFAWPRCEKGRFLFAASSS